MVSDRIAVDVRPGDAIQAGIHLEHSLLGEQATTVLAYILRLRCENGLTHRECVGARRTERTRRVSSRQDNARNLQYEQIRSLVAAAVARLEGKLEAVRRLHDEPLQTVEDVDARFERFLRQARMYSLNFLQLLRLAWQHELGGDNQLTYFGVLNAMTWLATYPAELSGNGYRLSERQRHALSRLAGIFANQHLHICPHCFSVVAGGASARKGASESTAERTHEKPPAILRITDGSSESPSPARIA